MQNNNVNIHVMMDVHHWVPAALRRKYFNFEMFSRLRGDSRATVLSFLDGMESDQPFRFIWTGHHEYGVRKVLSKAGWNDDSIDNYITKVEDLVKRSGGEVKKDVNYLTQAESDPALKLELSRLSGLYKTTNEDTAIIKMAVDFRCDLIVSNDNEVRDAADLKVSKWTIDMLEHATRRLVRGRRAAA